MCVYIYIYIHMIIHAFVCTMEECEREWIEKPKVCVCIYVYVCMCVLTYVWETKRMCVSIYVCVYVHTYICFCECVKIWCATHIQTISTVALRWLVKTSVGDLYHKYHTYIPFHSDFSTSGQYWCKQPLSYTYTHWNIHTYIHTISTVALQRVVKTAVGDLCHVGRDDLKLPSVFNIHL